MWLFWIFCLGLDSRLESGMTIMLWVGMTIVWGEMTIVWSRGWCLWCWVFLSHFGVWCIVYVEGGAGLFVCGFFVNLAR